MIKYSKLIIIGLICLVGLLYFSTGKIAKEVYTPNVIKPLPQSFNTLRRIRDTQESVFTGKPQAFWLSSLISDVPVITILRNPVNVESLQALELIFTQFRYKPLEVPLVDRSIVRIIKIKPKTIVYQDIEGERYEVNQADFEKKWFNHLVLQTTVKFKIVFRERANRKKVEALAKNLAGFLASEMFSLTLHTTDAAIYNQKTGNIEITLTAGSIETIVSLYQSFRNYLDDNIPEKLKPYMIGIRPLTEWESLVKEIVS